jgi:hypothetical protein
MNRVIILICAVAALTGCTAPLKQNPYPTIGIGIKGDPPPFTPLPGHNYAPGVVDELKMRELR